LGEKVLRNKRVSLVKVMGELLDRGRDMGNRSRDEGEVFVSIQGCRCETKFQGQNLF
jgi:hypothetical protein